MSELTCQSVAASYLSVTTFGLKPATSVNGRKIQKIKTCLRADCDRLAGATPISSGSALLRTWTLSPVCATHASLATHATNRRAIHAHQSCHWTYDSSDGASVHPEHNLVCTCTSNEHHDHISVEDKQARLRPLSAMHNDRTLELNSWSMLGVLAEICNGLWRISTSVRRQWLCRDRSGLLL